MKHIKKHIKRHIWKYVIAVFSLLVLSAFVVLLYCHKATMYEFIRDLATIFLVAIGIVLAIWRLKKFDEQISNHWLQMQVQTAGNISQRFHQAVGQLGSKREAVRTGAVHILNRLTEGESEQYLQEDEKEYLDDVTRIFVLHLREQGEKQKEKGESISEDMQAILAVFFKGGKEGYKKYSVEKNFDRFNLENVSLQQANLEEAYMHNIQLRNFDLSYAKLGKAELCGAKLEGTTFYRADLRGAKLERANFGKRGGRTNFAGVDLRDTCLDGTTILNTGFTYALLSPSHPYVAIYLNYISDWHSLDDDLTQWKKIFPDDKYDYSEKSLKEYVKIFFRCRFGIKVEESLKMLKKIKAEQGIQLKKDDKGNGLLLPMSVKGTTIKSVDFYKALGVEDVKWEEAREPEKLFTDNMWPRRFSPSPMKFHPLKGWIERPYSPDTDPPPSAPKDYV